MALRTLCVLAAALLLGAAHGALAAGIAVMHGFADQSGMTLWTQTERAARIVVEVFPEGDERALRRVEGQARAEDDFVAQLRLAGLRPGTRYAYRLLVDGRREHAGSFATQRFWQFREEPPEIALAFGSCAYVNDDYSRPGPPYGGDFGIFDSIAAARPDTMLWLGDNVYFREPEWTSLEGMSARYRAYRALPAAARLWTATSHLAVWDDHDFGPNDSDGSFVGKGNAVQAFRRYWPNPTFGLPGVDGIFGMVTLGDVDLFLLDNRFHRYPNRYPETADKAMFGRAQLAWLKQALVASRATFKIVAAGGQFWNRANRFETFHNYPAEQKALADWLLEQKISGVLFLSGDRHLGGLWRIDRPGTYPLYEHTSSPLTAGAFANPPAEERDNPDLVAGTLVTQRNFGMVRVAGPRKERVLTLETYAADGKLLWQRKLSAAELR
jgi:alkaline phosphatase D